MASEVTWQAFKGLFESEPMIDKPSGLRVFKDTDGEWRFVAWVTNKYRDRDGEILADAAHKEFVEYLDKGGEYPEAWLWHTPGTRWGQADFADYVEGFLILSGTVDKGSEAVAESLAKEADSLGVSHGFYSLYSAPDTIGWYRMQELSPLPHGSAANVWTGMDLVRKESAMAFSEPRRGWLVGKLGAEKVASLEGDAAGMAKALEDAGVDYKDMPGEAAPVVATVMSDEERSDLADAMVKAFADAPAIKVLGDAVAGLKAAQDQLAERLKAMEKTDDEKLVDLIKARVTQGYSGGERPSQSAKTLMDAGDVELRKAAPEAAPAWLKTAIMPDGRF